MMQDDTRVRLNKLYAKTNAHETSTILSSPKLGNYQTHQSRYSNLNQNRESSNGFKGATIIPNKEFLPLLKSKRFAYSIGLARYTKLNPNVCTLLMFNFYYESHTINVSATECSLNFHTYFGRNMWIKLHSV